MDPEFQTIITRVLAIGMTVGVIATTALVFAFRAFGPDRKAGSDTRAVVWLAGTIAFIILACLVLLLMSEERRRPRIQTTPAARSALTSRLA